jgi:hypothetical protein
MYKLITLYQIGVLHLPLQYVWLSSLFLLIGGGQAIATTMVTTMVADVVPPELRQGTLFHPSFTPPVRSVLLI